MNTADMQPGDALDNARELTAFLESAFCAFFEADDGSWPNRDGWGGLFTITILLKDLLERAGEKA